MRTERLAPDREFPLRPAFPRCVFPACLSLACLSLACLSCLPQSQAVADGLDDLRADVTGSRPAAAPADRSTPRPASSTSSRPSQYRDDDEGPFDSLAGPLVLGVVTAPVWIPRKLMDDSFHDRMYFVQQSDATTWSGMLDWSPPGEGVTKNWLFRFRADLGSDWNDLTQIGGQVLLDTSTRWGLDSEYAYRRDHAIPGDDDLWTGDFNLVYRFAQSARGQMRLGGGANWLADSKDAAVGFNVTYGGDVFLGGPWIASGELDMGSLGHGSLFHARTSLGVRVEQVELFVGYDYLDVGATQIDGVLLGVRLWH